MVNIIFDFVSDPDICTTVEGIAVNTELATREKFERSLVYE